MGTIFLHILLKGAFAGEFHDDGNFLLAEIHLVIGGNFVIPEFLETVDEWPAVGLHFLQVGIGSELVDYLIRVLFFIQLVEALVDPTMMPYADEFAAVVAIVGG